jgi:hypothetical protein
VVGYAPAGPGVFTPIVAQIDLFATSFISQSFGIEYTWRDWVFVTEYLTRSGTLTDAGSGVPQFDVNWGAWYVQADYRLDARWAFAAYYMEFLDDRDDTDGSGYSPDHDGWQKDFSIGTRCDINDFWNIKAELHFINGTALASGNEEDWTLFALKSTVTF